MAINDKNVVNELFWVNYAAEKIYDSFATRAKAVENLQLFVKWIFSLFTAGGFVLVFFGKGEFNCTTLVLFGIGFVLLIFSYFFSTESGYPVTKKVQPNEAAAIQKAYSEALQVSDGLFRKANNTCILGVFLMGIGTLIQFSQTKKPPGNGPVVKQPMIQLSAYLQGNGDEKLIPFTIKSDKNATIAVRVSTGDNFIPSEGPFQSDADALFTRNFITDTAGICVSSFSVPKSVNKKYLFISAALTKPDKDSVYSFEVRGMELPK